MWNLFRAGIFEPAFLPFRCHICWGEKSIMRPGLSIILAIGGLLPAAPLAAGHVDNFTGKPRIIVISDIGNRAGRPDVAGSSAALFKRTRH